MNGTEVLPELTGPVWTVAVNTTPSIASKTGELKKRIAFVIVYLLSQRILYYSLWSKGILEMLWYFSKKKPS